MLPNIMFCSFLKQSELILLPSPGKAGPQSEAGGDIRCCEGAGGHPSHLAWATHCFPGDGFCDGKKGQEAVRG